VNLDHVRRVEYISDQEVKITWSNGDVERFRDNFKPEENYHIVPATSGHQLLQYWPEEQVLDREPVLAWRIEEDQTKEHYGDDMLVAIGMDSTSAEGNSNVYSAVLAPDGVVKAYAAVGERRTFDSVEQWQKAVEQENAERAKKRRKMEAAE
jgi:hypothetical protein